MLKKTTAQEKIATLKKRVRIVRGGTSASKTFSIMPFLIDYAIKNPKQEISVVAETIPHLRRGALRDFLKIMDLIGMYQDNQYNKSSLTYTFTSGSFIEFFSADNPAKLRGARRDVLFINECNNVSWESYYQLAIRTRKFIYLDYNPVEEFWVDTELMNDSDVERITLTYKDNEALDASIVKEIEKAKEKAEYSSYWANWWRVYGLGEIGNLEGVIFSNYKQISDLPKEARLLGIGLDFGYTNDPTAAVAFYKHNDQLILDELIYQSGLLNSDIANILKPLNTWAYCDSAEPKSIAELNRCGLRAKGAAKGKDSVVFGIQLLQQKDLLVTKGSTNLIKELRGYVWEKDKTGKSLNKPIGVNDHAIAAMRYFAVENLNQSKKPTTFY
jgi:phage terminase large subunit